MIKPINVVNSNLRDNFKTLFKRIQMARELIDQLLVIKERYDFETNSEIKKNYLRESSKYKKQLKKTVLKLINHSPFLAGYKYPVNHLRLRQRYVKFLGKNSKKARENLIKSINLEKTREHSHSRKLEKTDKT